MPRPCGVDGDELDWAFTAGSRWTKGHDLIVAEGRFT